MSAATIVLVDANGATVSTMTLGAGGGTGTFGVQACGSYMMSIMNAPTCYIDGGGDVGPRPFTTDGIDTTNEDFIACSTCCEFEISAVASNIMCDAGTTPDDASDDMITFDIIVLDINGGGTTWSDNMGNTAQAYGTPVIYGPFFSGGSQSVVITADGADCTQTVTVQLNGCATVETIPTVGEWGLIMLGLLMSIVAVVGIRQGREEYEKVK